MASEISLGKEELILPISSAANSAIKLARIISNRPILSLFLSQNELALFSPGFLLSLVKLADSAYATMACTNGLDKTFTSKGMLLVKLEKQFSYNYR